MPTPLSSAGLKFFSSLRFQVGFFISLLTGHTVLRSGRIRWFFARRIWYFLSNPDPDPTCNNRFIKLFSTINKFKHKMMVYNIEFYAYLPKILIYFFSSFRFQVGSGVGSGIFFQLSRIRIRGKKCRILIPASISRSDPDPFFSLEGRIRIPFFYQVGMFFLFSSCIVTLSTLVIRGIAALY